MLITAVYLRLGTSLRQAESRETLRAEQEVDKPSSYYIMILCG